MDFTFIPNFTHWSCLRGLLNNTFLFDLYFSCSAIVLPNAIGWAGSRLTQNAIPTWYEVRFLHNRMTTFEFECTHRVLAAHNQSELSIILLIYSGLNRYYQPNIRKLCSNLPSISFTENSYFS